MIALIGGYIACCDWPENWANFVVVVFIGNLFLITFLLSIFFFHLDEDNPIANSRGKKISAERTDGSEILGCNKTPDSWLNKRKLQLS